MLIAFAGHPEWNAEAQSRGDAEKSLKPDPFLIAAAPAKKPLPAVELRMVPSGRPIPRNARKARDAMGLKKSSAPLCLRVSAFKPNVLVRASPGLIGGHLIATRLRMGAAVGPL